MPTTIPLGSRRLAFLLTALRASDVQLNDYAEQLLVPETLVLEPEPRSLQIDVRTVRELGFEDGVTMPEVLAALPAKGLAPCPLEAALHLRLLWRDPVVPRITVVSERVHADELMPRGFYLLDDERGRLLRGFVATDDWRMEPTERLAVSLGPS